MIKVWTDGAEAGLLDRNAERGSTFAYLPDIPAARSVSVTMPVRLPSWSIPFGLPPVFHRRPLPGRPHPVHRRQGAVERRRAVPVGR